MPTDRDPLDISRKYWTDELGDPNRFFAMTALLRLARRVGQTVDGVLESHGLNRNGYLILMSLELSGSGSMILGRLAHELIVHPTTVTLTVDRLEADGLVEKAPHETDRRATRVTVTKAGRALAKKVTSHLSALGFGFGDISRAAATRLTEAMRTARATSGDIAR